MSKGRRQVVVDTNVPITANRRDGGSYACASACANELKAVRTGGTLVVDATGLILSEYRSYLNFRGQPGAGDAFFRWFFNNRGKLDLCRDVPITPIEHEWRQFAEFPKNDDLSTFDRADQKFVATAVSAGRDVPVLQATDHKWLSWSEHLAKHGIQVRFTCKDELERVALRRAALSADR